MIHHSLNCLLCEDDSMEHKRVGGRYEPFERHKIRPKKSMLGVTRSTKLHISGLEGLRDICLIGETCLTQRPVEGNPSWVRYNISWLRQSYTIYQTFGNISSEFIE